MPLVDEFEKKVRDLRATIVKRDDQATSQCEHVLNHVDLMASHEPSLVNEDKFSKNNEKVLADNQEILKELRNTMQEYKTKLRQLKDEWIVLQLRLVENPVEAAQKKVNKFQ